jgi:L-ascorbate metabolism protein UlaG (beta-lactamase superfamily)
MKTLYLQPNVAFEPLICRWYAWPFLMAPAALSLVMKNRLLPILESFVEDPEFHRSAGRNPKMRGGPFVDHDGDVAAAQALLDQMRSSVRTQLDLALALEKAADLLEQTGKGHSLEPMYERMPQPLRGFVELGYDLHNHASLRLIEPLMYASPQYDASLQSVFLRPMGSEPRPFVMSTPLIDCSRGVLVNAPFADALWDDLARARQEGLDDAAFASLRSRVQQHCADMSRFDSLFTETPPPVRHAAAPHDGLRVRYFGHATLLIEGAGSSVLVDPSFAYSAAAGLDCFDFQDLPQRIDYLLLTHNHQDHVLFEFLLQLRHRVGTVVVPKSNGGFLQDPSLKLILEKAGFKSVVELDELGTIALDGGSITGLPFLGEHSDLHIRSKLGYSVELAGKRVMCLADSNNLEPEMYRHIARLVPSPDLLFIGMECEGGPMSWLYGSFLTKRLSREHDEARRLNGSNFARAKSIVDDLRPRGVFVYAMGAEPWFSHITSIVYDERSIPIVEANKLIDYCITRDIPAERLYGKREITLTQHPAVGRT